MVQLVRLDGKEFLFSLLSIWLYLAVNISHEAKLQVPSGNVLYQEQWYLRPEFRFRNNLFEKKQMVKYLETNMSNTSKQACEVFQNNYVKYLETIQYLDTKPPTTSSLPSKSRPFSNLIQFLCSVAHAGVFFFNPYTELAIITRPSRCKILDAPRTSRSLIKT